MADLAAVADLRASLRAAGYAPLALYNPDQDRTVGGDPIPPTSRGKVPLGAKWQEGGQAPLDARALNTGLLTAGLQAFDLDIDDPALVRDIRDRIVSRFGEAPMRIRAGSPRCLLLYRAPPGMQPAKRAVSGPLGKVEVLGRGQQFLALGTHYTGATLEWMPEAPGQVRADALPIAKFEDVAALLAEIAPLLGVEPQAPAAPGKLNGAHAPSRHGLVADIFDVAAALRTIPNDAPGADWEAWNRMGMALWSATAGASAGADLFHAWSSRHPSYDHAATEERWTHYATSPPTGIGAGTLFHMARQTAEEPPPFEIPTDAEPQPDAEPEPPPAPPARALWFSDAVRAEKDIPLRPWLAKGYLLRGSVTLIAGAGSAGKSSLFKAWSIACVLGISFHRFQPLQHLRALSYNVEDDRDEEDRRLSATLRQFGRVGSELSGNLRTVGPRDIGTLIERDPHTGKIHLTDAMLDLIQHIEEFKPDVVFLDPLVELHTTEENDNTGLRAIIAQLRALAVQHKIAIVLAHHARKGTVTPGDPDAVRGAGAIVGAARVVFTVCGMTDEEAEKLGITREAARFYFRLDGAKMNYTPLIDPEWFERTPYPLDNGEDVAAAVPWIPPRDIITTHHIETIKTGIRNGINGDAYTFRKGGSRSIYGLCQIHGISTDAGAKEIGDALRRDGYAEHLFVDHHRNSVLGIRSADGEPRHAAWKARDA